MQLDEINHSQDTVLRGLRYYYIFIRELLAFG